MKNNHQDDGSKEDKRGNMIVGLLLGAALGLVFWSALEDLLPAPFDLLVGMATGLIIGYNLGQRPLMRMRYPPRILRMMLVSGAALILGLFAYSYFLEQDLEQGQLVLASLLAIVPAAGFVLALGLAIASLDELQRRIQTEAIAIGFAGTALAAFVMLVLGWAGVPSLSWGWVLVVMTFMWMVGKLWTVWRYR